ncbi:MAG TPA: pilus assembly protein TadG-related protein, partial [Acidimicrobiia bacterium]|nr:pilus assembly protein TadG-related protein [Acidimicrobiia bacterium]
MMGRLARVSRLGHRSDRGASAVLVAVSMLVLMGFVAIAIDSGLLFNDRRQQQSAADGGALAAVQYARTSYSSTYCAANTSGDEAYAVCRGAEEAIAVVNGTLPGRYDGVPGNTLADWAVCTDPNRPVRFTRISVQTPCISFTHNFQEARLVLPGTDVATPFGGVIGIESARVGAYAHALLDSERSADILPFAIG